MHRSVLRSRPCRLIAGVADWLALEILSEWPFLEVASFDQSVEVVFDPLRDARVLHEQVSRPKFPALR